MEVNKVAQACKRLLPLFQLQAGGGTVDVRIAGLVLKPIGFQISVEWVDSFQLPPTTAHHCPPLPLTSVSCAFQIVPNMGSRVLSRRQHTKNLEANR